MTGARILRWTVGAAGLAALGYGVSTLLTDPQVGDWHGVLRWLVLALLLHDGVLVPVTLLLGLAVGARWRARLRLPFLVAGSLTAVALPVLLRPGATANPSVLPLDYLRGWVLSLAVVGAVALLLPLCRRIPGLRFPGVRIPGGRRPGSGARGGRRTGRRRSGGTP
ncbi:hypothetical protein [Actinacidiphila acididurans]|uniref:Uncharacterized protein n=1 Tax=Actinacidiphila acididurans TaxID=2784346 RepID=A0ABS2TU35_9ACTN|nr:hypothetical protein [Actinacidiphila acididurans]MBM9506844.1 hypothetical protein [Actinacidiphila acididurans]